MKSIFQSNSRSRRHRQAQPADQDTEQTPFFSAANQTDVQRKPQPFFQAKNADASGVKIGQPNDAYEREADAVADQVVNGQNTQKPTGAGGPAVQRLPITPLGSGSLQRIATPDEEKMPGTNDARMAKDKEIQEKPEAGSPMIQKMDAPKEEEKPVQKMGDKEEASIQKMEAPKEEEKPVQKMGDKEEEEPVQKMEAPKEEEKPVQKMGDKEEEEPIQAKSESGSQTARPNMGSRLAQQKGSGNPLPKSVKAEMEQGIGANFSGVRIHTDSEAVQMNKDVHAQAFTHGQDVYFNSGKYSPESTEGKRLLAHELTHVVQQGGAEITSKTANNFNIGGNNIMRKATKGKDKWQILSEELATLSEENQIARLEKLSETEIAAFAISKPEYSALIAKTRRYKLYLYHAKIKSENWSESIVLLNGFNNTDISKLVSELTIKQAVELFKSARIYLVKWPQQELILQEIQKHILSKTSGIAKRDRTDSEKIEYIVLHQTGSSSTESTLNTYESRVKAKSHIGAHYLIGKEGETLSTVPESKVVGHVAGNKDSDVTNPKSIGIEHVGLAKSITPPTHLPKEKGFDMAAVRTQIITLNLSPKLKARLLALNDKTLYTTLKYSGWNIYEDITGKQKRATLKLVVNLMRKYNLKDETGQFDISKLKAHEEADQKTLGEGENITEFLHAAQEYFSLLRDLSVEIQAKDKLNKDTSRFKKILEKYLAIAIHIMLDINGIEPSSESDLVLDKFFNTFYSEVENLRNAVSQVRKL